MIGSQDLFVALGLGLFFFGARKLPELPLSAGHTDDEIDRVAAAVRDFFDR
jgi:hypothetical protein